MSRVVSIMNVRRILTAAAAGSALLAAAAPAAQADAFASTLTDTALTASTVGEQVGSAGSAVLQKPAIAKRVSAVGDLAQAGEDTVSAGDQLVNG
ncbi:hypothetical protein [Streptomyces sp. NPDC060322]|uniref:hypothetical protein n=2 Tax=unclassified Streptomyces TaxID=2593676 RepID=UPI00365B56D2